MNQYLEADSIKLVHSGKEYFDTLEELIAGSKTSLHLQTYIFAADETGIRIISALKLAAKRGVNVYLLPDAFGSFPFPSALAQEMLEAGIHFRLYSSFFSTESILLWRRLHHKIVVADDTKALIGGLNIADKYNSLHNTAAWLDYAVLIEGSVCVPLNLLCEQIYRRKKTSPLNGSTTAGITAINQVRFRRNDWLKKKNEIHRSYIEALKQA